jgi:hypothetical protein
MDTQEIEILERLKSQFEEGFIVKKTVIKSRDIWNKYNMDKINYCMCTKVRRQIYAKQFIDWYEDQNR